jgi:hypothetical protein
MLVYLFKVERPYPKSSIVPIVFRRVPVEKLGLFLCFGVIIFRYKDYGFNVRQNKRIYIIPDQ